jgi:hypothetical protein
VRAAAAVLALLLAAPGVAAQTLVPNRQESTFPDAILVVGRNPAHVPPEDALGRFTIVVRDVNHTPIAFCPVTIDFSLCGSDLRLCARQPGRVGVDPTGRILRAVTDAQGRVDWVIVGDSHGTGPSLACGVIRSFGVFFGMVVVATLDLQGSDGLNPADFDVWIGRYLSDVYSSFCDYDFDGRLSPHDLSFLINACKLQGSVASACP